jgi:hypothetical protein
MSVKQAVENRNDPTKVANLVILHSDNGSTDWKLVKPEDVPVWVKDPDCIGHLVHGQMATHPTEKTGWYRAERVDAEVIH